MQIGTTINFKSTEGNGSSFWFELEIDEFYNDSEDSEEDSSLKPNLYSKLYTMNISSSPPNSARQNKEKETKLDNLNKLQQSFSHNEDAKIKKYEIVKNEESTNYDLIDIDKRNNEEFLDAK